MTAPHPRMHGLTHVPGGPDPVPGLLPSTIDASLPSLIGWWPLDDPGPVAVDHSVSAHNLSVKQPANPPTWGQPGPTPDATSVLFNHVSGFAANTDALIDNVAGNVYWFGGVTSYTWEIRLYPTAFEASHEAGLMSVYTAASGSTNGMQLTLIPGGFIRFWRAGLSFDSPVPVTLNQWVHVAVTYDGVTLRIYLDGVEKLAALTSAPHSASGSLELGTFWDGSYRGNLKGRLADAVIYNEALDPGTILQHATGGVGTDVPEGWVLGIDENGNPVWLPPATVTVNGEPPDTTPEPPRPDPVPPPDGTGVDGDDWIEEQPFTWGGPTFEVPPNKWTTIPFTTPLMERHSNVTGGSTTWFELDWDDPAAAGWIDPATPRVITIPHDMEFNPGNFQWFQICLKLEIPPVEDEAFVEGTTTVGSHRGLRVFETTHQKSIVEAYNWRSGSCDGHGALNVFRDPTKHAGLLGDAALFAFGDTGGEHDLEHGNIMLTPNSDYGYYLPGFDWLPGHASGNPTLKKGMRLVPQVWHNAHQPLTFDCTGVLPYRPHFVMMVFADRGWGPPWSDWPTSD
jgi:hypothetical protein